MTTDVPTTATPGAARRSQTSRAQRRAPADLPFAFADRDLARALAAERDEPGWLRDQRLAASEAFDALPIEPNQLYTPYIDLRLADLFGTQPYIRTESVSAVVGQAPDGVSAVLELVEDGIGLAALSAEAAAAGVQLETLGAWLAADQDGFRAALEASALAADERLAQLPRGFWSQGIRLVVPAGVRLAEPILLRWAVGRPDRALITQTFIDIGEGAHVAIVEELVDSQSVDDSRPESPGTEPGGQALLAGTSEVRLGRGASLSFASIQELPPNVVAFWHRTAAIGDGATLNWALGQLGGRLVRSRVDNRLEGDRSSVEQVEIVFASEAQLFDLTSYTRHVGRDATSNLLSKAVLQDTARTFLKGLVTIDKTGVGTDSFLGEYGLNLSRKSRAVTIPSLEIDQPDCRRVAHSSSVGPIDETQLFYLESRGIPPEEARKFIVLGYLEPVVARVPLASAQDRLRALLEEKWDAGHPRAEAAA